MATFVLPELGRLQKTGDQWAPYQIVDQGGIVVGPVRAFFAELQAEGKSASTVRSYGMDLLRWWRFLWALDIEWNRATRADARDFTRWMQIANKPQRLHWRHRNAGYSEKTAPKPRMTRKKIPGTPNAITGKASPGPQYAARTRAHCETVLRTFYDFHLDEGTGPPVVAEGGEECIDRRTPSQPRQRRGEARPARCRASPSTPSG